MTPNFHFATEQVQVKLSHFPTRKPLAYLLQSFTLRVVATEEIKDCLCDLIVDPSTLSNVGQFFSHMFLDGDDVVLILPERMLTGGASVPKFLWRIIGSPFAQRSLAGFLIHDLICYLSKLLQPGEDREAIRLFGDNLLPLTMRVFGDGKIKRSLVYRGVKIGGFAARNDPQLAELPIWDGVDKLRRIEYRLV